MEKEKNWKNWNTYHIHPYGAGYSNDFLLNNNVGSMYAIAYSPHLSEHVQ